MPGGRNIFDHRIHAHAQIMETLQEVIDDIRSITRRRPDRPSWSIVDQRQNREAWIAALRSRRLPEGTDIHPEPDHHLRGNLLDHPDRYSPLGVGCEVFRQRSGSGRWEPRLQRSSLFHDGNYSARDALPEQVRKYYGLSTATGSFDRFDRGSTRSSLMLEIYLGGNFVEIADIIAAEPSTLLELIFTESTDIDEIREREMRMAVRLAQSLGEHATSRQQRVDESPGSRRLSGNDPYRKTTDGGLAGCSLLL